MPKALLIVAQDKYKDKEYLDTKAALEENDIDVRSASKTKDKAKGVDGGEVDPDFALADVTLGEFDAIVFIGGEGSEQYFKDEEALKLAKQAHKDDKIVAAICIAPTILANAGLLKGVRATAFESAEEAIKKAGADFTGEPVESQGLIFTASGPDAAEEFGDKIALTLMSESIGE
ncbi:DJ-1/PfpI family protein [Patescibacteria group bacterium]